jgi:Bacteriophage tail sheath protein
MIYKTPGVYVEEISSLPPSVAEIETAIPAFIGYTEKAKLAIDKDLIMVPTRITSMLDYISYFGGAHKEDSAITVEVKETKDSHGNTTELIVIPKTDEITRKKHILYYSMQLYFSNGGGPCYIVSVGDYSADPALGTAEPAAGILGGLKKLQSFDEPTILLCPDAIFCGDDLYEFQKAALDQCKTLMDRFTLCDLAISVIPLQADGSAAPANTPPTNDPLKCAEYFRTKIGNNNLMYGAAYYPHLKTSLDYEYDETKIVVNYTLINLDAAGNPPNPLPPPTQPKLSDLKTGKAADATAGTAAVPANNVVYNKSKNEIDAMSLILPPSPAIAGVYVSVDNSRGVWKAPANITLNRVSDLTKILNDEDQRTLNVHETGKSVNVIRSLSGIGMIVWGARTLMSNSNEWRYINIRRFFSVVEESVKKSTLWAVFEPNTKNTWVKIKSMIGNYLILKWKDGALVGAKPEDSFYVRIGLGETMTAAEILEGYMNVEIGMAVARPAEFIVLRFSHKSQVS